MMTINPATVATCQFTFTPVVVKGGRKFQGPAFYIGGSYTSHFGYAGSGVCPLRITEKVCIWDPVTKNRIWINSDYVKDRELDAEALMAAKIEYVSNLIQTTVDWYKSTKPNMPESELEQLIRNVLKKQHAELLPIIDELIPDNRDVVGEIQKTLQWAMTLKTRECFMYGRHCTGGKPLSNSRKIAIARKALQTKGITKLNGFDEAWEIILAVMGLSSKN